MVGWETNKQHKHTKKKKGLIFRNKTLTLEEETKTRGGLAGQSDENGGCVGQNQTKKSRRIPQGKKKKKDRGRETGGVLEEKKVKGKQCQHTNSQGKGWLFSGKGPVKKKKVKRVETCGRKKRKKDGTGKTGWGTKKVEPEKEEYREKKVL